MSISNYFKCKQTKFSNKKTEWLNGWKQDSSICCLQKAHSDSRPQAESDGMEKTVPANENKESWGGYAYITLDRLKQKLGRSQSNKKI